MCIRDRRYCPRRPPGARRTRGPGRSQSGPDPPQLLSLCRQARPRQSSRPVSYTHLRAHETSAHL
eukprot:325705-Alexandrium_andersonii.AAC.1